MTETEELPRTAVELMFVGTGLQNGNVTYIYCTMISICIAVLKLSNNYDGKFNVMYFFFTITKAMSAP